MDPLRGRADFKTLVAEGIRKGPKAPPADSKKTEAAAVSRPAQLSAAAALRSPPWPRRIKRPPNTRSAWSCSTAAGSTMPPNTSGGHAPCVSSSSRANPRASSIRRTWPRRWRAWPGSTREAGRPEPAARSWRESARLLARVVAQRPDDRQAWKDLGIAHAELGERDDAATAFARLLELTPEFHRAACADRPRHTRPEGRPSRTIPAMVAKSVADPRPGRRANDPTTPRSGKTLASSTPNWVSRRPPQRPLQRSWS